MAEIESEEDKQYRKASTRHMFKAAVYSGFGMAAFFGLLTNIVGQAIKAFQAHSQSASTVMHETLAKNLGFEAAEATTSFLGVTPIGWAVIGGLMAIGVASTYMAQIEGTKLKQLQDNWLAKKNAAELSKGRAKTPEVEYPQNQRSDNQLWTQVEDKNRLKLVHNQASIG